MCHVFVLSLICLFIISGEFDALHQLSIKKKKVSLEGRCFRPAKRARRPLLWSLNYLLKKNPPVIQHPKFENSRLGFIESIHER